MEHRWPVVVGTAALLLTASCSTSTDSTGEGQGEGPQLVEMVDNSRRIEAELLDAEYRVVLKCMEDQGFTVHDPWSLRAYESPEEAELVEYYPHEQFLVPPEEAELYGFGQWLTGPDGREDPDLPEYEDALAERAGDASSEQQDPDTADWDALSADEQREWYVAYQGEALTAWQNGDQGSTASEGEVDVEDDSWDTPKPGGCQLAMIEMLYGEPELVEESAGNGGKTETATTWVYRPENPAFADDSFITVIDQQYTAAMATAQADFLGCIEDRGYEGWAFTPSGALPIAEFFGELYYQNADAETLDLRFDSGDPAVEVPAIPEEAGEDYEDWKAYEIRAAVDFGACGEATGFAAASEAATDDAHYAAYATIEPAVYAWQEEMNASIAKAQEFLK